MFVLGNYYCVNLIFFVYYDIKNRIVDDNCGKKLKVYIIKLWFFDVYCKGKYFME